MPIPYLASNPAYGFNPHALILPIRIIGGLILLAAIVPAGLAVWSYLDTSEFLRTAVTTQAKVVAVEPQTGGNGDVTYRSVFTFTDQSGKSHRVTSNVGSSPAANSVGDTITVHYQPTDPNRCREAGFFPLWALTIITGLMTVLTIVMSLVPFWLIPFTIHRIWPKLPVASVTPEPN